MRRSVRRPTGLSAVGTGNATEYPATACAHCGGRCQTDGCRCRDQECHGECCDRCDELRIADSEDLGFDAETGAGASTQLRKPKKKTPRARATGDSFTALLASLGECIHALAEMNAAALDVLGEFATGADALAGDLAYSADTADAIDDASDAGRALTSSERRCLEDAIVRWAEER